MATEDSIRRAILQHQPLFRKKADKIAFAVHCTFVASDFVLTATGDLNYIDHLINFRSNVEAEIDHWNDCGDFYHFAYLSMMEDYKVLVSCYARNDQLIVSAVKAMTDSRLVNASYSHVLDINHFLSGEEEGYTNLEELIEILKAKFISKLNHEDDFLFRIDLDDGGVATGPIGDDVDALKARKYACGLVKKALNDLHWSLRFGLDVRRRIEEANKLWNHALEAGCKEELDRVFIDFCAPCRKGLMELQDLLEKVKVSPSGLEDWGCLVKALESWSKISHQSSRCFEDLSDLLRKLFLAFHGVNWDMIVGN